VQVAYTSRESSYNLGRGKFAKSKRRRPGSWKRTKKKWRQDEKRHSRHASGHIRRGKSTAETNDALIRTRVRGTPKRERGKVLL